jgi:predicted transcriptional regulator of viral defense system
MQKILSKADKMTRFLAKSGVATASELVRILGNRMEIKRGVEAGLLHPLGSGIYAAPSLDPFSASVIAASRFYPQAVISNITALVIHGLSDESVPQIDVDIPRGKSLKNRLLRVHRVTASARVGETEMRYQGHSIRIYDPERTLCEAYRIDPDGAIFFKALKRYMKLGRDETVRIALYDERLGTRVLARLRQEMADG